MTYPVDTLITKADASRDGGTDALDVGLRNRDYDLSYLPTLLDYNALMLTRA